MVILTVVLKPVGGPTPACRRRGYRRAPASFRVLPACLARIVSGDTRNAPDAEAVSQREGTFMGKSVSAKRRQMIFQFLVVLVDVDPLVWRRIRVPGRYSFWDLHVAIQDAMGWLDYHLHEFKLNDPESGKQVRIGLPDDEDPYGMEVLADHLVPITDYFIHDNEFALYTYDFGDGWRHLVVFEDLMQPEKGVHYPHCLSGERKCPPEDCGGPHGYERFLEAIRNPDHEEHEEYLAWIGGNLDPEDFSPELVQFDDAEERWRMAFDER